MGGITPIPVATYGTNQKVAQAVCEKLLPDFEVVHVCLDYPSALRELPPLFAGDLANAPPPSSGLGTHAPVPPSSSSSSSIRGKKKIPQALFFGGGFTDDEYDGIVEAVRAAAGHRFGSQDEKEPETEKEGEEDNNNKGKGKATAVWKGKEKAIVAGGKEGGLGKLHVVKVQRRDVFAAGGFGPNPDIIARLFKRKMAALLEQEV